MERDNWQSAVAICPLTRLKGAPKGRRHVPPTDLQTIWYGHGMPCPNELSLHLESKLSKSHPFGV